MSMQEIFAKIAKANEMVEGVLIDDDGTGNDFENVRAITDTPVEFITLSDPFCSRFLLEEVYYWMNPTAAETYELVFLEAAEAQDVDSLASIVFRGGDLRADSVPYLVCKGQGLLPRIVNLAVPGIIYFMMIWTGAPGNTPGLVKFRGRKVA